MHKFPKGCKVYAVRDGEILGGSPYRTKQPQWLGDSLWNRTCQKHCKRGDVMVIQPRGSLKWGVYRAGSEQTDKNWYSWTEWHFVARYTSRQAALMAAVLLRGEVQP